MSSPTSLLDITFVEAGPQVYLFPNITVRDVDLFIANITVTLELCTGGSTADRLSWDPSFLPSVMVDYPGNQTHFYTVSSPDGDPQVYTDFLR